MKQIRYIYIMIACFALLLACKKSQNPELNMAIPAPKDLAVTSSAARKATVQWAYPTSDAKSFTVELSTSATFATAGMVKQLNFKDSVKSVTFDSLKSLTPYYVRVQASNGDPLFTSAYTTLKFTSEEIESIFNPIVRTDVGVNSVVLTWNQPKAGSVTRIILTPQGGTAMAPIVLTPADITAKRISVTGLVQATSYTAIIYDKEENKGEITFITLDPNQAITINSSTVIYESLQSAVTAAVSGDVINVGVAKYDFTSLGTVTIAGKSIIIKGNGTDSKMPEVTTPSFALSGNVSTLKISGIKFIITSGNYFIDASGATGASDIQVDNVDVTGPAAGLIYASTAATSANIKFSVLGSLLHDFGAVGGDFIDFRGGIVSGITVKNTSIWNVARDFFRIDATATCTVDNPLLIENCTINDACHAGRFLYIRSPATILDIKNCILSNKSTSKANTVSGTGTKVNFVNNNVFGNSSTEWGQFVTTTSGTTTLDPQYTSAATGNFTVGNATVKTAGRGDPRWLK